MTNLEQIIRNETQNAGLFQKNNLLVNLYFKTRKMKITGKDLEIVVYKTFFTRCGSKCVVKLVYIYNLLANISIIS